MRDRIPAKGCANPRTRLPLLQSEGSTALTRGLVQRIVIVLFFWWDAIGCMAWALILLLLWW